MAPRVLSLVTTRRSFYQKQEAALESQNIQYETLPVPGTHDTSGDEVDDRSPFDYVRFCGQTLRKSFDGYDLVHANYGLTAPAALLEPRLPTVLTLWGGEFVGNSFEPLLRFCANRADEVIVPSRPMAGRVNRETTLIPFPIDSELFRPIPKTEARERVGWDTEETVVLFPYAKSRYEKNYALAKRVVDGLDHDVTLRPVSGQPYEEIPYYMNASDALLLTSRWESGPMAVKEAMACDLPVVSTPVGFAPDVLAGVSNSAVGETETELRDHLETILRDGGPSDGRETVAGYGVEEMGERIAGVYERALR